MPGTIKLSEGALQTIMKGGEISNPIMQILGSKRIAPGSTDNERYRLLLSDGQNRISFAMLNTQINERVKVGEIKDNTVIKVKRYITSVINNSGKGHKRILVILEMETIISGDKIGKIGNPLVLPEDDELYKPATPETSTSASNNISIKASSGTSSSYTNGNSNYHIEEQLINPIASLSPYQNKWVIKARVTNKSQIREWSNSRGEGKLFSIDLLDNTGEIRATIFRDLVDTYYDIIEIDKVYYISKCVLKVANKQFSSLNNDYEMTFTNETVVRVCTDDSITIPQTHFDFISIDKIEHIEAGTAIDVIGVCSNVGDLVTFQAKSTGRDLKKRELTIVDQSNSGIALTLWGVEAEKFNPAFKPVIAIKGAKVGEFGGGKNISVVMSSILKLNPDIPESHKLRGWYDNGGMQQNITNLSAKTGLGGFQTPWLTFKDIQNPSFGTGEKGEYFQNKGTLLLFRTENSIYKACPIEDCKKKLVDLHNGMYRCEKCNREYPNFKYRLMGSVNFGDWSSNIWISMFSSEVENLLGTTAQMVGEALENDSGAFNTIASKAYFKEFIIKCRSKMETYNDESRLKTVAIKIDPINYKDYNAQLISKIQELNG